MREDNVLVKQNVVEVYQDEPETTSSRRKSKTKIKSNSGSNSGKKKKKKTTKSVNDVNTISTDKAIASIKENYKKSSAETPGTTKEKRKKRKKSTAKTSSNGTKSNSKNDSKNDSNRNSNNSNLSMIPTTPSTVQDRRIKERYTNNNNNNNTEVLRSSDRDADHAPITLANVAVNANYGHNVGTPLASPPPTTLQSTGNHLPQPGAVRVNRIRNNDSDSSDSTESPEFDVEASQTRSNTTIQQNQNMVEDAHAENLIVARLVSEEEELATSNQKKLRRILMIGGGCLILIVVLLLVIVFVFLLSNQSTTPNNNTGEENDNNNGDNSTLSPAPVGGSSQYPTVPTVAKQPTLPPSSDTTKEPTSAPIPQGLTVEQTLRLQQYGNVAFYGVQYGYSLEECEDPVGQPTRLRLICRDDADHIEVLYHEAYINGASTARHSNDIFHVGQAPGDQTGGLLKCDQEYDYFSGFENGMRLFCYPGDTNATGTLPTQFRALLLVACAKGQPGGAVENAMDLQAHVADGAAGQNCGTFDTTKNAYVGDITMGVSSGHFCFPSDGPMTWNIGHPNSDSSRLQCATGTQEFVPMDNGSGDSFLACARLKSCEGADKCPTNLNSPVWRQEEAFLDGSRNCILNRGVGSEPDDLFQFSIDDMVQMLKSSFSLDDYSSKVHAAKKAP